MIRDEHGIIMQQDSSDPNNMSLLDGGDSAFSTGMMSLWGSEQDTNLLSWFIVPENFSICRHPNDPKWKDPKLTSRDQVVAWAAGVHTDYGKRVIYEYAKSGKVNSDVLSPLVRLYLYGKAGEVAPLYVRVLGLALLSFFPFFLIKNFLLDLAWNTKVKPVHEMNQAICIHHYFRTLPLLLKFHPDLIGNMRDYYCGWRRKPEMFEQFLKFIERYK